MKKITFSTLIFLCFSFSTAFAQTPIYPYFRFDSDEWTSKISYYYIEIASLSDTLSPLAEERTTFLPNCLRQKTISNRTRSQSGLLQESFRDSLVYENGKLKDYYYLGTSGFVSKKTLFRSADLKSDTITDTLTLPNVTYPKYRSILLRNRSNQDSLYFEQVFSNGAWTPDRTRVALKYNNVNQLVEIGEDYLTNNVITKKRVTTSVYDGANLISGTTSSFENSANGTPVLSSADRVDYKYNAQKQLTETVYSYMNLNQSSSSFSDTFRIYQRDRSATFNAKNFITEYFSDAWNGRTWTETQRGNITYRQDSLPILSLGYDKFNGSWRLRSRVIRDYCSFTSGTSAIAASAVLTISPNPASNAVTITSDVAFDEDNKLILFNNAGQVIFQRSSVVLPYVLDVSNIPQGLYFTKMSTRSGQTFVKKFVIVK